jgi:hypothetical protein
MYTLLSLRFRNALKSNMIAMRCHEISWSQDECDEGRKEFREDEMEEELRLMVQPENGRASDMVEEMAMAGECVWSTNERVKCL